MSNPEEWIPIIEKLIQKTEERKLEWEAGSLDDFKCALPDRGNAFEFLISRSGSGRSKTVFINMFDPQGHSLINANSTTLPTSPPEEHMSDQLEFLYELVRRQALKVDEKIKVVSDLLDRA